MNVTAFSTTLAAMNPKVKWPSIYADEIFNFYSSKRVRGAPVEVGISLHNYFDDYSKNRFIPHAYYEVCASIVDVLADLGMEEVECEESVSIHGLEGRLDMHGIDLNGRHWVIEIKTTQGAYLKAPSSREIFQLALYAKMLDLETLPSLMCLRVNLQTQKIGVYRSYDCREWVDLVRGVAA